MSLAVIKAQMEKFLSSKEAEVLAIRGDWGVGKTFTWEQTLREAQKLKKSGENPNAIGLNHYSYVSLFGISSLQDLRTEIAFNKVNTYDLERSESVTKFQQASGRYMPKILSQALKYAGINVGTLVDTMFASMSNSLIRNTIVCIDDFERCDIPERETLGFINDLKCKRDCKVVLLLNENKTKEYKSYREKVIDYDLNFKLTPDEAAKLVFGEEPESDHYLHIIKYCKKLKINNIRVIQKIKLIVDSASDEHGLDSYISQVGEQFVETATLGAYCFYEHKPNIPNLDYIRDHELRNRISIHMVMASRYNQQDLDPDESKDNEIYKEYEIFLSDYGFESLDKFDEVVIDAIESGFIDSTRFSHWANERHSEISMALNRTELSDLMDNFTNGFLNNEQVEIMIKNISEASESYMSRMTKSDLNNIYSLFDFFGCEEEKAKLFESYRTTFYQNRDKFNTNTDSSLRNINWHSELEDLFREEYQRFFKPPTAKEILDSLSGELRKLKDTEIQILNNLSQDDIKRLINEIPPDRFRPFLELLVKIGLREPRVTPMRNNVITVLHEYASDSKQAEYLIKQNFGDILQTEAPN